MASLTDRRAPGWLGTLFRMPVPLFRLRLGWLFGGRLLMLTHVGRRTGRNRSTVLEVVSHEANPTTWYVAAAWGDRSDWYRNLKQDPNAEVSVGRGRHRVVARAVDGDEAIRIYGEYLRAHPRVARVIGRTLGIHFPGTDPGMPAGNVPLVALTVVDAERDIPESVSRVVTNRKEQQATYDRIAPFYEAVEGLWERRARAAGLNALAPGRGEALFEIGCGPGATLAELAATVGPGGTVVGVDLAFNMCRLARERLQRRAVRGTAAVAQGDAVHLPLVDGVFDGGLVSFTLELFDTPEIPIVLAECRRVLRPGGRLAVVALSKENPPPPMQQVYEWGHARFPRLLDCRPIQAEHALADAGFSIAKLQRVSLWGIPVAVVVGEP